MLHLSTYPSIVPYLSTANGVVDTDDDDDDGSEKLIIVSHQSNRIICISKMKKTHNKTKTIFIFYFVFHFSPKKKAFRRENKEESSIGKEGSQNDNKLS